MRLAGYTSMSARGWASLNKLLNRAWGRSAKPSFEVSSVRGEVGKE